jgi:hypothetical protein
MALHGCPGEPGLIEEMRHENQRQTRAMQQ